MSVFFQGRGGRGSEYLLFLLPISKENNRKVNISLPENINGSCTRETSG